MLCFDYFSYMFTMETKPLLAFLLVATCASPTMAQNCVTRQGIAGECTRRNACKPFQEFVSRSSFTSLNQREQNEIVFSWRCGRTATVCCPNDKPYTEPPPSVEGHKNLPLLPPLKACGSSSVDRLHGGNDTELLEYPWMALISTETTNSAVRTIDFTCGGTVINSRYILTAAHCITKLNNLQLLGVRVGEWDKSTDEDCVDDYCVTYQDIAIEEVLPHPGYVGVVYGKNRDLRNDIGLLRLADPIDFTIDNLKPICLPTTKKMREANIEDQKLTLTGWGRTNILEDGSITTSKDYSNPRLLQITVPLVPNKICAEKYNGSGIGGIGFRHLCASGLKGVSSCDGDSGGPMMLQMALSRRQVKFVQFGVVSAGFHTCGIENQPGILTNVLYYMDWILDTLKP